MSRSVVDLLWAKSSQNPWPKLKRHPRGAKGLGLGYELALAKALPNASHGLWFEFCDRNGRGFCSPDLIIEGKDEILAIECKLTNYPEAVMQLTNLYRPVLTAVYHRPVRGLVALKYLNPASPKHMICPDLASALRHAPDSCPILHWIGRGPV